MTEEERLKRIERRQLALAQAINELEDKLAHISPQAGTWAWIAGRVSEDGVWHRGFWS